MVVVHKRDFGESDSQLELAGKYNNDVEVFSNCDSRGMLQLDQDSVINTGNINNFYRMDKGAPFATGLYAQVKRCKSLKTNSFYAAKFCPRKRPGQSSDEECIENLHEIALLSQLQHPYIISFIDAFILDECAVTIMELAPGGDLQTVIDADLVLLEKDASRYILQLLEALKYLHERHIAHLDIKPQNLLLMGEFPTCDIKLCDFEISRVIKPGKEVKEILGTPDYVAPEILLYEPLSTSADMWSVGILGYVLLTGFSPFGGDTDQETFRNIVHEPIDFPDELFEDISPSAIDFIIKLAVKNAKLRPTPTEMEEHEWIKSFIPEIIPQVMSETEPAEPISICTNSFISHSGPKKRSPRRTMAGSSTASAAGRRLSAKSILRACKSAYDLNKMGGITKSREALVEKMKMASGDSSVGGNWKLRKNLSKSREQLWESKIQLSKSCEKINNNLPGSTRWASVSNFPSLDLGAMKSSTSQESVISVVSTCTNVESATVQQDLLDWQQQSLDDLSLTPRLNSISMPNTPPIPNFDLSSPVNNIGNMGPNANHDSGINYSNNVTHPTAPDFNYPSLVNGTNVEDPLDEDSQCVTQSASAADQESQKTVAELIMTFGGSRGVAANTNNKKLDLKNLFEPILEVDGSEEQTMSLGDCSDNNSTSGVSSIIATTVTTKEPKSAESGHFSMNSSSSNEQPPESLRNSTEHEITTTTATTRQSSRTVPQIREQVVGRTLRTAASRSEANTIRRGSATPTKLHENGFGLKGILKKPTAAESAYFNGTHLGLPPSTPSSRRGSIPGNCTRLYDTHTISSLAKVPKKSILKNSQNNDTKSNRSSSLDSTANTSNTIARRQSGERSSSKSPENVVTQKEDVKPTTATTSTSPETSNESSSSKVGNKGKVIPKGLSPRERPSFILLNDVSVKPKLRKPTATPTSTQPRQRKAPLTTVRDRNKPIPPPTTPRAPPKPRTSIREQIMRKKAADKSAINTDKLANVTVHIPMPRGERNIISSNNENANNNATKKSPPASPTEERSPNNTKKSTFKSELKIEPAAVAIKIFPPDPVILPKSNCNLSQSQSLVEENNNDNNYNNNSCSSNSSFDSSELNGNSLLINNNNANLEGKSPEVKRRPFKSETLRVKGCKVDFERSTWGVVCTGSIGRAMERFETGTIKGKKLRRGSVPDF